VSAVLGTDEHFFSRRQGYPTTLCDLKNRTVYDVVLGRREASLEGYFHSLEAKGLVLVLGGWGQSACRTAMSGCPEISPLNKNGPRSSSALYYACYMQR